MKLEQKSVCRIFLLLLSIILALALVLSSSSFFQQDLFVSQQLSKQRREQQQHLNISSLIDDTSSSSSSSSLYQEQYRKFPSPTKNCSCENKTQQQQQQHPRTTKKVTNITSTVNIRTKNITTQTSTITLTLPRTTTTTTTNRTTTVDTKTTRTAPMKLQPQQPREPVLDLDLADFPPLDIRISSSSTAKPAVSGDDIINLINKKLFTKSLSSFTGKPQNLAENTNNNTILPWLPFRPVSCVRHSTILCDAARGVGGPLRLYQDFTRNGHCCGFVSRGKFSHSFSSDIFQTLSDSFSNSNSKNKNKNNKNKNKKNKNKLNIKKIIERIFPIAEDLEDEKKMYHLLSKMGETSSSQNLLETIFSGLGKDRISLKDAALSLLLGISQLRPVDVEVVVTNNNKTNNKTIIQKAPRIFLHGNSYIRALISNIAALFRGQHRYFDRGSHLAVRYTVTTHGDYYWMANDVKKESDPDSPNATKPLLEKVVLRNSNEDEEEVVLLDIVYFYRGSLSFDGVKQKFGPRLESRYVAFRGSFSAIFMRFVLSADVQEFLGSLHNVTHPSVNHTMLRSWTQFHIEEYFSPNSVSPQGEVGEDSPQDYFVAVHITPISQIAFNNGMKSLVNAATREKRYFNFIRRYVKPFFERGRDNNRTIKRHVMLMPPEKHTFNIIDESRHCQCILLPHFPAKATQFRSQDTNLEKCVDMLSRNFWTQFGLGAFLSAKSTREYFRKLF